MHEDQKAAMTEQRREKIDCRLPKMVVVWKMVPTALTAAELLQFAAVAMVEFIPFAFLMDLHLCSGWNLFSPRIMNVQVKKLEDMGERKLDLLSSEQKKLDNTDLSNTKKLSF